MRHLTRFLMCSVWSLHRPMSLFRLLPRFSAQRRTVCISELLALPVNCEARQKREGSDEDAYGLRWWPAEKGAAPMVKWIIPSMAGVVEAGG